MAEARVVNFVHNSQPKDDKPLLKGVVFHQRITS